MRPTKPLKSIPSGYGVLSRRLRTVSRISKKIPNMFTLRNTLITIIFGSLRIQADSNYIFIELFPIFYVNICI